MEKISVLLLVFSATSFTLNICLILLLVFRRRLSRATAYRYPVMNDSVPVSAENILEEEPAAYDVSQRKQNELLERFKVFMDENKPFLDPNVTIEEIATSLGSNKTTISKLINDKFGMNFRQLLNSYRVKEALTIFSGNNNMSMDELRVASGFNSVSTFTSSFSRFTGCTPGEYCKKIAGR